MKAMIFAKTYKRVKRLVVLVVGYTVLAVGVALLVLPGPAFIVIPIGLAILATEVVWARNLLERTKEMFKKKAEAERNKHKRKDKKE